MKKRHRNDGIRKLCDCARRTWPKCPHPWHFNFKWNGEHFRFTLEKRIGKVVRVDRAMPDGSTKPEWRRDRASLGRAISGKSEAQHEA